MRFSVDELKAKADEAYEPVEIDLPSGGVARFENLLRLPEEKQVKVTSLLNEVRDKAREAKPDAGEGDDEVFDVTKVVDSVRDQLDFMQSWVGAMVDEDVAAKVKDMFGGDLGYYLFLFNTWMAREGDKGEAKPSAS